MNYRLISTKEVIAKVYRDLKPSDSSWTTDAIEWIGEALDFIGYHAIFDHTSKELNVVDHKAEIPCDLYQLIQVEYEGTGLVYGTDTTGYTADTRTTSAEPANSQVYTVAVAESNPTDDHSSPAFTVKFTKDRRVHPVFNWEVADNKWGHYCVAAQNDLAFPSIDKMETMKNMFVRMVPMINRHSDFFIGNETQERLDR
jgi:hypothetical protein